MNANNTMPAMASIFRRFMALVYDCLLVLAILLLGTFPWVLRRGEMQDGTLNPEPLGVAYQVFCLALIIGYFLLGWWRKSATLGMRSWRMQLVSLDDGKPTIQQMLIRLVTAPFAWLPLGLGILWQYRDPQGLTLHDRTSRTRIVLLKKKSKPNAPG